MLWDVDGGLPLVDKYLYSNDNHVVAGALLAVGIINCGVRNECDPVGPLSTNCLADLSYKNCMRCSFRNHNKFLAVLLVMSAGRFMSRYFLL